MNMQISTRDVTLWLLSTSFQARVSYIAPENHLAPQHDTQPHTHTPMQLNDFTPAAVYTFLRQTFRSLRWRGEMKEKQNKHKNTTWQEVRGIQGTVSQRLHSQN